jgi:uncharacterized membrane protein (DUF4010 family)
VLIAFFNPSVAAMLAPGFAIAALAGVGGGWYVSRRADGPAAASEPDQPAVNPLELKAALLFAAIFVTVLVATTLVREYLGHAGLYTLAGIMGVTDVVKAIYAHTFSDRDTGRRSAVLLVALAAVGLVPLVWV